MPIDINQDNFALSSITSWMRLEPRPRDVALSVALQALVQDPLWLLSRQWQFGEFQGEDCGSPVKAELAGSLLRINNFAQGKPLANPAQAYSPADTPLETRAESEAVLVPRSFQTGLAADLGRHFFRLLGPRLTQTYRSAFLRVYALAAPAAELDDNSRRWQQALAGRVLDGLTLYRHLKPTTGVLASLPAEAPFDALAASERAAVLSCVIDWLAWCDSFLQTQADPAWVPEKLEYEFTVAAATPQEEILLHAPEHRGDRLDWHAFDLAATVSQAAGQPRIPIPSRPKSVTSSLSLSENGVVGQLQVRVRIKHSSPQDLKVWLLSPAGGRVLLAPGRIAAKKEWWDFTCDSRTQTSLATLCGQASTGTWSLRVSNSGKLAGTLSAWWLTVALTSGAASSPAIPFARTLAPTPLRFQGMPAPRWWEFEDGRISFGSLETGAEDLGKLLLMEFTLAYGNDFFMLPLEMEPGTLCRMQNFRVTNTFGEVTDIPSTVEVDGPGGPWRLYALAAENAGASSGTNLFFLAPTLGPLLEGKPLEEVRFLRDEMANLAWAVERRIVSPAGLPLDRFEAYQESRRHQAAPPNPPASAGLEYMVESEIPDYWLPLLPQPARILPNGSRTRDGVLALGGLKAPLGTLLQPAGSWTVHAETIPRTGVNLTRGWQYARWNDGSRHVWVGRSRTVGRGEGSSGLAYDQVKPKNTP